MESDKKFALSELETSRSEATRYRQVKHTEISKLQAELEIKTVEGSGAVTTLSKLKKVHDNLVGRHEELNAVLASTKEELSVSTGQFTSEMGSMRRLVETLEAREVERKNRLQQIESSLESQSSDKATRESELVEELQLERERFDALEIKFSEMREALEQFSAPVHADSVQSPRSSISNGFALSPSAQMAVRKQKTGKSYAEVYVEYVRMQEELALERAETKRLGECLTQILTDIEERVS